MEAKKIKTTGDYLLDLLETYNEKIKKKNISETLEELKERTKRLEETIEQRKRRLNGF